MLRCLGRVPGNAFAVPSQQGLGGYDPAAAQPAWERGGDRPEKRSIVIVDGWPINLAVEYLELAVTR